MERKVKILGIVGSLRKGSYNKALMRAAIEVKPKDSDIEIFDVAEIPPFNQENENDPPQIVKSLKAKIKAADALLIATPEYNYSVPSVLKNAIDLASRPYAEEVFDGKPVGTSECVHWEIGRCPRAIPSKAVIRLLEYASNKLPRSHAWHRHSKTVTQRAT